MVSCQNFESKELDSYITNVLETAVITGDNYPLSDLLLSDGSYTEKLDAIFMKMREDLYSFSQVITEKEEEISNILQILLDLSQAYEVGEKVCISIAKAVLYLSIDEKCSINNIKRSTHILNLLLLKPFVVNSIINNESLEGSLQILGRRLPSIGDYECQALIFEALYRITCDDNREYWANIWFLNSKAKTIFLRLDPQKFEINCRNALNYLNRNELNRRVFSYIATTVNLGSVQLKEPPDYNFWIDFNYDSKSISFYCCELGKEQSGDASELWETILICSSTVQSYQIRAGKVNKMKELVIQLNCPCSNLLTSDVIHLSLENSEIVIVFWEILELHSHLENIFGKEKLFIDDKFKRMRRASDAIPTIKLFQDQHYSDSLSQKRRKISNVFEPIEVLKSISKKHENIDGEDKMVKKISNASKLIDISSEQHFIEETKILRKVSSSQPICIDTSEQHLIEGTKNLRKVSSSSQPICVDTSEQHLIEGTKNLRKVSSSSQPICVDTSEQILIEETQNLRKISSSQPIFVDTSEQPLIEETNIIQKISTSSQPIFIDRSEDIFQCSITSNKTNGDISPPHKRKIFTSTFDLNICQDDDEIPPSYKINNSCNNNATKIRKITLEKRVEKGKIFSNYSKASNTSHNNLPLNDSKTSDSNEAKIKMKNDNIKSNEDMRVCDTNAFNELNTTCTERKNYICKEKKMKSSNKILYQTTKNLKTNISDQYVDDVTKNDHNLLVKPSFQTVSKKYVNNTLVAEDNISSVLHNSLDKKGKTFEKIIENVPSFGMENSSTTEIFPLFQKNKNDESQNHKMHDFYANGDDLFKSNQIVENSKNSYSPEAKNSIDEGSISKVNQESCFTIKCHMIDTNCKNIEKNETVDISESNIKYNSKKCSISMVNIKENSEKNVENYLVTPNINKFNHKEKLVSAIETRKQNSNILCSNQNMQNGGCTIENVEFNTIKNHLIKPHSYKKTINVKRDFSPNEKKLTNKLDINKSSQFKNLHTICIATENCGISQRKKNKTCKNFVQSDGNQNLSKINFKRKSDSSLEVNKVQQSEVDTTIHLPNKLKIKECVNETFLSPSQIQSERNTMSADYKNSILRTLESKSQHIEADKINVMKELDNSKLQYKKVRLYNLDKAPVYEVPPSKSICEEHFNENLLENNSAILNEDQTSIIETKKNICYNVQDNTQKTSYVSELRNDIISPNDDQISAKDQQLKFYDAFPKSDEDFQQNIIREQCVIEDAGIMKVTSATYKRKLFSFNISEDDQTSKSPKKRRRAAVNAMRKNKKIFDSTSEVTFDKTEILKDIVTSQNNSAQIPERRRNRKSLFHTDTETGSSEVSWMRRNKNESCPLFETPKKSYAKWKKYKCNKRNHHVEIDPDFGSLSNIHSIERKKKKQLHKNISIDSDNKSKSIGWSDLEKFNLNIEKSTKRNSSFTVRRKSVEYDSTSAPTSSLKNVKNKESFQPNSKYSHFSLDPYLEVNNALLDLHENNEDSANFKNDNANLKIINMPNQHSSIPSKGNSLNNSPLTNTKLSTNTKHLSETAWNEKRNLETSMHASYIEDTDVTHHKEHYKGKAVYLENTIKDSGTEVIDYTSDFNIQDFDERAGKSEILERYFNSLLEAPEGSKDHNALLHPEAEYSYGSSRCAENITSKEQSKIKKKRKVHEMLEHPNSAKKNKTYDEIPENLSQKRNKVKNHKNSYMYDLSKLSVDDLSSRHTIHSSFGLKNSKKIGSYGSATNSTKYKTFDVFPSVLNKSLKHCKKPKKLKNNCDNTFDLQYLRPTSNFIFQLKNDKNWFSEIISALSQNANANTQRLLATVQKYIHEYTDKICVLRKSLIANISILESSMLQNMNKSKLKNLIKESKLLRHEVEKSLRKVNGIGKEYFEAEEKYYYKISKKHIKSRKKYINSMKLAEQTATKKLEQNVLFETEFFLKKFWKMIDSA